MCTLEGSLRLLDAGGKWTMGPGGAGNSSQGAGEKEVDVRDILKQELGVRQRYQFRSHLTFLWHPKQIFGWKAVVQVRLSIVQVVDS